MSLATLPALATYIDTKFPMLGGRVLPVSEAMVTKDNVPTLPLCMLALLKETSSDDVQSGRHTINEEFVVEFWFKPERYQAAGGGETPFWAFFDYDAFRTQFVAYTKRWKTPHGQKISYKQLDITSTDFALVLCFRFEHKFVWCEEDYDLPEDEGDGKPLSSDNFILDHSAPCSPYCVTGGVQTITDNCSTQAINKRLGLP